MARAGKCPAARAVAAGLPSSAMLAVPAVRTRYLTYVREMVEKGLNWTALEPALKQYVTLIEPEVALDTRKTSSTAAFKTSVYKPEGSPSARGISLQAFIEQRREYLLNHPEIKKLAPKE